MVDPLRIEQAAPENAAAILTFQRLCHQSEAELAADWTNPPPTQTLDDLVAEFATHANIVARLDGDAVGSVRARLKSRACRVGRLIVHPHRRRQGFGSRLMATIERAFPAADRFEVFTGPRSEEILQRNRRLGDRDARRTPISPQLILVFLRAARVERTAATGRHLNPFPRDAGRLGDDAGCGTTCCRLSFPRQRPCPPCGFDCAKDRPSP